MSPSVTLGVENDSRHGPWLDYYTRAAAVAVNARYRWVFDRGFYERLDPDALPENRETPFHGVTVATSGAIHQDGPITGLWHDGWAERRLAVPLVADADLAAVVIRGHAPHAFPAGLHLSVTAGSDRMRHEVATPRPFAVRLPHALRRGGRVRVVVEASDAFCPRDQGGADTRSLSWVLATIDAEAAS